MYRRLCLYILIAIAAMFVPWHYAKHRTESSAEQLDHSADQRRVQPSTSQIGESANHWNKPLTLDNGETERAITPAPVLAAIRNALAEYSDCQDQRFAELLTRDRLRDDENGGEANARLMRTLQASSNTEHLHTAALMTPDRETRTALLFAALDAAPDDALLLVSVMQYCHTMPQARGCDQHALEQRALRSHSDNSAIWIHIAARRASHGDLDGALVALQTATDAPTTNNLFAATVERVERALQTVDGLDFMARTQIAFGIAASNLPDYSQTSSFCLEQAAQSIAWANDCLRYFEAEEQRNKTMIGEMLANTMQQALLIVIDDPRKRASLERRRESLERARRDRVQTNVSTISTALLLSEPAIFQQVIATYRTDGELAAVQQLERDVKRVLAERGIPVCEIEQ